VNNIAGWNKYEMEASSERHLSLANHSRPIAIVSIQWVIVTNKLHLKYFPIEVQFLLANNDKTHRN